MSRWNYDYYPKPVPIKAEGGIKAAGKKRSLGESWWAKRWQSVVEGFNIGARLSRGRTYARSGQGLSVEIRKGEVHAQVQGSRAKPYKVVIKVAEIGRDEWERLANALAKHVIFAAKLLAGEMPKEIETVFAKEKLTLFPVRSKDLSTNCSCPDWSNPCKHIAAVYSLRGIDRTELLTMLGPPAAAADAVADGPETCAASVPVTVEQLCTDPETFWEGTSLPEGPRGEITIPAVSAALPKSLGRFPFWRSAERFPDALALRYGQTSQEVTERLFGK